MVSHVIVFGVFMLPLGSARQVPNLSMFDSLLRCVVSARASYLHACKAYYLKKVVSLCFGLHSYARSYIQKQTKRE
jgi:hypothetical protein